MSTFQKLGEEVDRATAAASNAQVYLRSHKSPEEFLDKVNVIIQSANWADGSMDLQQALRTVIQRRMPDLVQDALALMTARADESRRQLQEAFDGRASRQAEQTGDVQPPVAAAAAGKANGTQARNAPAR